MTIGDLTLHLELGRIELEYLAADARFAGRRRPLDEASRSADSSYKAAGFALDLSLAIIDSLNPEEQRRRQTHA